MSFQYRNPVMLPDGRIQCEVKFGGDHPLAELGWSEYTAIPGDDPSSIGPELYMLASSDPNLKHLSESRGEQLEKHAKRVRLQRNVALADSDWTQGSDVPARIKEPYAVYRKALRDVPSQSGFPLSVSWPDEPKVK